MSIRTPALISVGGGLGAGARYGLELLVAPPWGTLLINVVGCFLIGVLMAFVADGTAPAWARPLLGVGVLGGFTTFSAYTVDARAFLISHEYRQAAVYLCGTIVLAMVAVFAGSAMTRGVKNGGRR